MIVVGEGDGRRGLHLLGWAGERERPDADSRWRVRIT